MQFTCQHCACITGQPDETADTPSDGSMRCLFGLCWCAAVLHAHAVGFQTFVLKDPTRSGRPMTAVAVHVWYPAQEGSGRALTTRDYLSVFRAHLDRAVAARIGAVAVPGRWPLVLSGFEGAHTASLLGEHLASRGSVVASFVTRRP